MTGILLVFLLIIAIEMGIALWRIKLEERKLSWKILAEVVRHTKWVRMSVALGSLVFAGVFTYVYQVKSESSASVQITLNYAEASKGQHANGVRYNMSEIISDEVVKRAIDKGVLEDVSVSQLEDCLVVYPLVEGDSNSEEGYHISTEFGVTFKKDKNTKHLDAYEVVQLLGYSYKDFYIETYADDFRILDISIDPMTDFENMDYMDIKQKLELQADEITNYMYGLAEENGTFVASNGETFLSIGGKCTDLKNELIKSSLESYILQNGISKNSEEYIGRLSYDNKKYGFEQQKAEASFNVRNQAVQKYSEEMAKIVLVPTWDASGEYYMGRTKIGIDELSVEAETYSKTAAEYLKNIQTNESNINVMQSAGKNGTDEYAENLIKTVSNDIMALGKVARQVAQEYSETRMNQCISINITKEAFMKYAALCTVLTGMFYIGGCLVLGTKRIEGKEKNKEGF